MALGNCVPRETSQEYVAFEFGKQLEDDKEIQHLDSGRRGAI